MRYALFLFRLGSIDGFAAPPKVNVGSCSSFAVVAGATVTNQGYSIVNGDLALSPGTAVTGFPPGEVIGTMHKTDNAAAACIGDLSAAITDANGRAADQTMNGEIGGMTLSPGVYKSDGNFKITNILTLDGQSNPNAAWIFIMAAKLIASSGSQVVMINYDDSQGTNVWWSCGERADIFTTAIIQGTVLAYQSIAVQDGATTGPLMAHIGEVTLLNNVVHSYDSLIYPHPTSHPSTQPTSQPSRPTASPTFTPTAPTANPTVAPTRKPSQTPSTRPTTAEQAGYAVTLKVQQVRYQP